MLTSLDIQNVVLIDRLSLAGDEGLVALTGETGAGKSILLDALGLALGARAESGLVRAGSEQATVTACFDLPAKHPVFGILKEKGIAPEGDGLIFRRVLSKDGRSKAFINDAPVGVQLMKEAGSLLIEIHGQFETQGLLDPATHAESLDAYAGIDTTPVRKAFAGWRAAQEKRAEALRDIETTKLQEEYLKHVVAELEKLDPKPGEEDILAEKRQRLLAREKMSGTIDMAGDLIEQEDGIQSLMGRLQAALEKVGSREMIDAFGRAQAEISELAWQIERIRSGAGGSEGNLEEIENRYFALRECAKKHRCTSDDLPKIFEEMSGRLRLITHQDDALADLERAVLTARTAFVAEAGKISEKRQKSAQKLAKAVNAELPDLKLDKAKFFVDCVTSRDEKEWHAEGFERVQFSVSTNPQTPAGPLHKIASGGELSRFMLALKVILAETGTVPTLIFDEVDSGIGGAVADAVGERLQRLGQKYQVLVVTHSPQVASRAQHHWHVAKSEQKGAVVTRISPLKEMAARTEEIARMLSGAKITAEARAQATQLLKSQHAA
jgi:DNA repair protein RecN (Recombination protein N)